MTAKVRTRTIPFSVPYMDTADERLVRQAMSKKIITGDGSYCQAAEKMLQKILGAHQVFLTTSGTHALELALMALNIERGDEVICPSFTFVSTANAIVRQGARPVFAEIETSTLNLDLDDVERRLTRRTKAIIPVHYAGFSCDMERLAAMASRKHIAVIEDAAQAVGARYNGRSLGTFGALGCISFHSTKNITCGEGGAIVVNRKELDERIRIIREKGTNRSLFLEGKVEKYTWIDVGSSFVLSDILAAFLVAQLQKFSYVTRVRRELVDRYHEGLKGLEEEGLISLPHPDPKKSYGNGHIFWILLNKGISRGNVLKRLNALGVGCTHHYVPLHSSPFGVRVLGYRKDDLPVTEDVARRLLRLPVHPYITDRQVRFVIRSAKEVIRSEA